MKKRLANCPGCGGPVEFQLSTALVTVCDFCHTVVARGDKSVEDHGKVADLVETNSPFRRGQTGTYGKKHFEIVGRVQYQHPAGGVWDEWYLKFPGDKVRWLAAAQGKFYLTTERRVSDDAALPAFSSLKPGHKLQLPDGKTLVVAESGIATARAAVGDIPWDFRPNAEHRFADLHGPGREFATIEYDGDTPRFFLGQEISLSDLQLEDVGWDEAPPSANTPALQVNCPHCAGPLALHAPDETLRVSCPHCDSLLDCQHGKLEYLQTLQMSRSGKPQIPLGSVGTLFETQYTVIGFMERFVLYEGTKYSWTEYLLYQPSIGFRWLVNSRGHWSFVEPVPVSEVSIATHHVMYDNQKFRLFDMGKAYVQYVAGEFYWRVTTNEVVETSDFIAPPRMISLERSETESGSELNISLGRYVDKAVLEQAFQIPELPRPWSIGAIQPPPRANTDLWLIWLGTLVLLILLNMAFSRGWLARPVSQFHFYATLAAITLWPVVASTNRHQFEVRRWRESDYSPYATGD